MSGATKRQVYEARKKHFKTTNHSFTKKFVAGFIAQAAG